MWGGRGGKEGEGREMCTVRRRMKNIRSSVRCVGREGEGEGREMGTVRRRRMKNIRCVEREGGRRGGKRGREMEENKE